MKVIIILTIEIPEKLILDSHPVQLQNLPKAKDFFSQKLKIYIHCKSSFKHSVTCNGSRHHGNEMKN